VRGRVILQYHPKNLKMTFYKNVFEWSNAMLLKGYTSGQDSKGAYYMDKLGFKHRWREGGIGGLSVFAKDAHTAPVKEGDGQDLQQYGEGFVPDFGIPDMYNQGAGGIDAGNPTVHAHNTGVDVTDKSHALGSLSFITRPQGNKFGISSMLGIGEQGQDLNKTLVNLREKEKKSKECICVRGLNEDNFMEYFDLQKNYLFYRGDMKNYPETYKTPISKFLVEYEKLFEKPYSINNCYRKAHFLAQAWWETDRWRTLEEYEDGVKYNTRVHKDAIANGNTEVGDGPKYKGRGCFQLTWKNNYKAYNDFVNQDLINDPYKVAGRLFLAVNSAGWFWKIGKELKKSKAVGDYNAQADARHTDTISRWVNGGGNGLNERKRMTDHLLKVFNSKYCINMQGMPKP
jgi:predicted chitinase